MKMLTRWVPGGILVAVAEGGVLALDGSAQAMEAMWAELTEHRCLGDLLRSLSRLHDNEVFTLPDFLMMAIDGQELRVAARGRFCLHLDTADGERSFNASEVIVWEESRYDRVNQCILELTPATGRAAGPEQFEELLPLRSGIVRASQLHIGFGSHQFPLPSPGDPPAGPGRRRPGTGRPTGTIAPTCDAGPEGDRSPGLPRSRTDAGTGVLGPVGRRGFPARDRLRGPGHGAGSRRRSCGRWYRRLTDT